MLTKNTDCCHSCSTFRAHSSRTFLRPPKPYWNSRVTVNNELLYLGNGRFQSCELLLSFYVTFNILLVQLNQLNDDLGKVQKELQSCQGNINTLNSKLTYDM